MGLHHHAPRASAGQSEEVRRFYDDPFFKDPAYYGTYVGRCKALLTGGVHVAGVAVLVPEVSIWANYTPAPAGMPYAAYKKKNPEAVRIDDAFLDLSMRLLRAQLDYDYLDDEAFLAAEIRDGGLRLHGESYEVLVLPPATTMRFAVAEKIARFRAAGGRVVACGEAPGEAMERGKDEALRAALSGFKTVPVKDVPATVRSVWTPDLTLAEPDAKIFYIHKKRDGQDIYFFCNMAGDGRNLEVTFHGMARPASLCDPRTGRIAPTPTTRAGGGCSLRLALPKLGGMFVVFG
jgi:hypothetical protein